MPHLSSRTPRYFVLARRGDVRYLTLLSGSPLAQIACGVAVTQKRRAQQRFDFGHRSQTMPRYDLNERVTHQEIEQRKSTDDVGVPLRLAIRSTVEIHMERGL